MRCCTGKPRSGGSGRRGFGQTVSVSWGWGEGGEGEGTQISFFAAYGRSLPPNECGRFGGLNSRAA